MVLTIENEENAQKGWCGFTVEELNFPLGLGIYKIDGWD
jgi:hypothetical protein